MNGEAENGVYKCRYTYGDINTYAFLMSDKYIIGVYTQCLSEKKVVALENMELLGLSETELSMVKLEIVRKVLFQVLSVDDMRFRDGKVQAELCTIFLL